MKIKVIYVKIGPSTDRFEFVTISKSVQQVKEYFSLNAERLGIVVKSIKEVIQ